VPHAGIAESDATVLWTQIAVLLSLAWLLGLAARRLGQPPIVGSLLAGLVAGPSVFGQVFPPAFHWFHPADALQGGLLSSVANFSLLILLIALGAETDLPLIRQMGRPAASVISGSLALPLAAGAGVALLLPRTFGGAGGKHLSFVLLIAAAMAVSSLPVIARLMSEMHLTRRNVGQLSIATATVNDGVGFVVLALAIALVSGGGSTKLVIAVVGLVGLVGVLGTLGQRVLDAALRRSRRHGPDISTGIAICAVFTFGTSAVAQALGVDAALGAFLAGILIGRSRFLAPRVMDAIEWSSNAIFAPLYFATAGLAVDVTLLGKGNGAFWFAVVLVVALLAKWLGVYVGARASRIAGREASALGFSLNGRGAMQVILASAGLTAGVLTSTAFTVVILVSIVSAVLAPPAIRRTLRGWEGSVEEQERLEHEQEMQTNVVVRGQRLLLPSRGTPNSVAAARILDLAWPDSSEVTLLCVGDIDDAGIGNVRATLTNRVFRESSATEKEVVPAILSEANLGYGAIGVGVAENAGHGQVLPPFIETLLNHTPIPLVLVRRGENGGEYDGKPVIRPRRILVPVTGSAASRAGQEVAHTISQNTGADLTLLHVVTRPQDSQHAAHRRSSHGAAQAVLSTARDHAVDKELSTDVVTRIGAFSGAEIEEQARESQSDLVVLGTTVRRLGDHPFLGHTVDHLLEHLCEPTIVVVVLPDAQQVAADEHIDREAG
jgi:Kef-type K+ transport system membrane component KefB/nucleotide-binding universal stress UspA family protein